MVQPLAAGAKLNAYLTRLRSSHDFSISVEILDLNENLVGNATLLDGQVNVVTGSPVRRQATLTISDPAGALDFSNASAWSGTSLWADRLVRVVHDLEVPGYGTVRAVPFIGPPSSLARNGAEVQVECQDKAALAMRGARGYVARKGSNAAAAIVALMRATTGEFRFRIPGSTRRLSKDYAVGLSDDAAPMLVALAIAQRELGMGLFYSCDGYLTARETPTQPVVHLGAVTEAANSTADFTTLANFVQVLGKETSKKAGANTVVTRPVSSATSTGGAASPTRLQRQGVTRLLPLIITEDGYTKTSQTLARAKAELAKADRLQDEITASVVPMFHLDADDVVAVQTAEGATRSMRFSTGSIPLGVGGDMTIGYTAWVSRVAAPRYASKVTRRVEKPKHYAKKHHRRRHRSGR